MGELTGCLNCGTPLQGAFCAACGQRAVPPNPTVRELAGDAWHELSGYDGRIMSTIRGLLRPGFLTREYLEGRRAHYLPPLRVYLIVSVDLLRGGGVGANTSDGQADRARGLRIRIDNQSGRKCPTKSARRCARSWMTRRGFCGRCFARCWKISRLSPAPVHRHAARVLCAAAGVCRDRRAVLPPADFPTALVFAVHLHAFAFIAFTLTEALKFTGNNHLAERVGAVIAIAFGIYALKSFRAVFGGGWPITLAKAVGIGFVYLVAAVPAFIVIILWASWI